MTSMNSIRAGTRPHTQRGVTLVVGLVMLLILTLFAVSAIRLSTANLRTVGNMQARTEATAAAQAAIEEMMSSTDPFTAPAARTIDIKINKTDYTVAVAAPVCVLAEPVFGNSHNNQALALQDTYWDVVATATPTDEDTGANVTIHQGVRVRLASTALCP
jgi:type II secretory pathway pseudopilin PulG